MKSERVYPYQLEANDRIVVRPKSGDPYAQSLEDFKRTANAVSFRSGGQFYHFGTVGRAREGVMVERVVHDHTARPWPFAWKDGKIIEDQLCACGRLHSEHGPGFGGIFGHGPCDSSGCDKFTWVKFVERNP